VIKLATNSGEDLAGLPYSLRSPGLYINIDLLREAGISENVAVTWEDVRTFTRTKKEGTGKYGFSR
jgi:ABC-type glycerol-3-phosphate transport system substrate-binding protein